MVDKLRFLSWKGSLTTITRQITVVLLVLLTFLIIFQVSSRPTLPSFRSMPSQLGMQSDVHDEQARIAKISILYGGNVNRAYERALQTHKRHNRKHGYPMFIQRVEVFDGYWTKPAFIHYMILRELRKPESQRPQWMFWFDADTIVLNYNVVMEDFLPPDSDEMLKKIHILCSDDWNVLNNGIFGIRVTRYAAELFAAILAFRDFEPDTRLPFQDQSAMDNILKRRRFVNHVAKVPQRWFNAYEPKEGQEPSKEYVHAGDFLVHFAGVSDRESHMNEWCDRSEKLSPMCSRPLHETWYPQEIERFWNRTKSVHEARRKQWELGLKHLTESIILVNKTMTAWRYISEKTGEPFLTLLNAHKTAEYFMGNISKIDNNDVLKEDFMEMDKIALKLEGAQKIFSVWKELEQPNDGGKQRKKEDAENHETAKTR